MSIKFKSFHNITIVYYNDGYCNNTTDFATAQIEKFIEENNIEYANIKDIKFSVDSKGNEHILLVYEVPEE